jgi:hypothetical protein
MAQYPQLVGDWIEAGSVLELHYRDTDATVSIPACGAAVKVLGQTSGMFSGGVGVQGQGSDSDRQCTYTFDFTAQMTPDGTITSFSPSPTFRTQDCSAGSDASFSGTVTSTAIRIVMKDRGTCRGATGRAIDTDRTLTISVIRRSAAS